MAAIITPSDQTDVPAGRATLPTRKLLAYSGRYRIEPPVVKGALQLREALLEAASLESELAALGEYRGQE